MISKLQVGSAWADITPGQPMPNYNGQVIGRSSRTLPLQVRAVVCKCGEDVCAIVSIDATFIDELLVNPIRERLSKETRIPAQNILLAATHSHATPATCKSFLSGALPDAEYLQHIVNQTCAAVHEAAWKLETAYYRSGTLPSPVGWCRRWLDPSGQAHFMPENRMQPEWRPESSSPLSIRYILFENEDGEAVGGILNVPCHNNYVFETYHGDFFSCTGMGLREILGQKLVTVTLAAPCGEIACREPDDFGLPGDAVSMAERTGLRLSILIANHLKQTSRKACDRLVVRDTHRVIADRTYADSDFCYDDCRGSSPEVRQRIRRRYDPEEAAVTVQGASTLDVESQCIAFGDTAIVTNPAELFHPYDERIQAGSPFAVTLVSELTNGYCGYVPTPEAFLHGCYETHRTVYTSRLVKDAGERICEMSLKLLKESHAEYLKRL